MADWFKFYENDLDETRLQYAISKLPEVVSVWVGILSVCCQDKSRTIRWGANEIELFGFSRRLGISIPKVNESVRLLGEIDYIILKDGKMTVTDWNSKQSEYCRKDLKKRKKTPNKLPTVSGHNTDSVPSEESRGEEIRKDESTEEYSEVETAFRKSGKSPLSEIYTPESRVILHELNELTGRRFRETSESLSPINARMREPDVTLEGVRKMISRQAKMWKGTHLEEYLRPSTLFGKEKFNEYYAARESEIRTETHSRNTENPRNAGVATDGSDYGKLVALKIQRDNAKRIGTVETKLAGQTPELGITPP